MIYSLYLLVLPLIFGSISCAIDDINATGSIRDGETLVSAGGIFELGFFSPGYSTNRYEGIWYKKIVPRTVVWAANREIPVMNRLAVLKVIESGFLILLNDTNGTVWSSNTSRSVQNPVAQLLGSELLLHCIRAVRHTEKKWMPVLVWGLG